jgi:hypothetical protein
MPYELPEEGISKRIRYVPSIIAEVCSPASLKMNGWFCCTATAETTEEFCPKIQTRTSETFPEGAAPWKENGSPRRIVNELLLSCGHWTGAGVAIVGGNVVMGRDGVVETVVLPVVLTGADDHEVHPAATSTHNRTVIINDTCQKGIGFEPDIVAFMMSVLLWYLRPQIFLSL